MYRERMGEGHGVVEGGTAYATAGGGGGTSNNSREADGDRYEWLFKVGPLAVGKYALTFSHVGYRGVVEFRVEAGRDEMSVGNIVHGGVCGEIAGGGCGC